MIKMSEKAHGALQKIVGSILRTYGMEALLTSIIDEVGQQPINEDAYLVDLHANLGTVLTTYQQRYSRN